MFRNGVIADHVGASPALVLARLKSAPVLLAGAVAPLLVVALFFGGATETDRLMPIGLAAVFVAAAAVVATLAGLVQAPRLGGAGLAFFGLLAGFVLWSGLSVVWSIAPDLSWDMLNREVAYLAFAVAGLYVGALVPGSRRFVAAGLALALGGVLAWALAGKVIPALFPDGARFARIRSPVGYWNGLALLAAFALVLGLYVATESRRRALERALGAVLVFGAIVVLVLTLSRGGIGVAVLGVAAWMIVSRSAFETLATLALAGAAAVPALVFALTHPGLSSDHQPYATRVHDGALLAPLLLGGAAVVLAVALLAAPRRVSPRTGRAVVVWSLGLLAAAIAAVLVVSVVRAGGPWPWLEARAHDFTRTRLVTQTSSRLTSFGSNFRWEWWGEAWRSFEHAPVQGRGAGSFPLVHLLERSNAGSVTQPHDLFVQALSDTGAVGFLLLLGAIGAAAAAVRRTLGRLSGRERLAGLALSIGAAAYLVQSLVDIDWDFVAMSGPVLFVLGVLVAEGARERVRRPVGMLALACAVLACAAAASLLVPWLSNQKTNDAYAAIFRGDPGAAAAAARRAHSLNPLSVEPLFALAEAQGLQGRLQPAGETYARAVELQPDNPDTWYALGQFEFQVLHDRRSACADLTRAFRLDRFDPSAGLRAQACS